MGTDVLLVLVLLVLVVIVCAWAAWDVTRALRISKRLNGPRVITCPETGHPAAVTVDVRHAVASGLVQHAPDVRLRTCSRWPERGRCDERCIAEAAAPENMTHAIAERALTGKACVFCGKKIERVAFLGRHAALLQPDRSTVEWPDLPPRRLREALVTQPPVCWDCHVAETFRRLYPELVTDRPWRRG